MSENPLEPTSDGASSSQQPAAEPPEKKPRIPLLDEPVFGKWGWLVTLVPYVIYLGGLGMASWIEASRATVCLHNQEERVLQQFYYPAKKQFLSESGETDPQLQEDFAAQKFRELGLTKMNEDVGMLTELKIAEKRTMFAPLTKGAPGVETRPWLLALYDKVQEPAEFFDKLLAYDEDGKLRPILAEYYQRFPDEYMKPDGREASNMWFPPDRTWYPTTYTIVTGLTALSVLLVFPWYFRHPFKVTWWSVLVGAVGIVVWIGLWKLDKQMGIFKTIGELLPFLASGGREAFNPLDELADTPTWRSQFMAVRFFGLVVLVPFIEEFFLRGWLMRYIEHPDWDRVPIGVATWMSIVGVAVYAVLSHNFEPLAAIVWFSMVTWLLLKTRSIWDCVVAHAITNLLLGLYVVYTGTWELW